MKHKPVVSKSHFFLKTLTGFIKIKDDLLQNQSPVRKHTGQTSVATVAPPGLIRMDFAQAKARHAESEASQNILLNSVLLPRT